MIGLDIEKENNSISVSIPIIIGLNAAVVIRIFNLVFYKFEKFSPITVSLVIGGMLYAAIFYQQKNINSLTVSEQTPKDILHA